MPVDILHIPKIRILCCATVSTCQGAIWVSAALSCLSFVCASKATAVDDLRRAVQSLVHAQVGNGGIVTYVCVQVYKGWEHHASSEVY